MKKPTQSFFCLLGFVLLLFNTSVNAQTGSFLSFDPVTTTIKQGDTVPINLVGSELTDIYAYQFSVSYNPEILKAVDVKEGGFLSTGGSTFFIPGTIDNIAGIISFTGNTLVGGIPGVSGNGILAILGFEAIAPGLSSLALGDILFLNSALGDVPVSTSDGSISVSSCGSVLGSVVGTGKCIENGTMAVDANNQVVTGTLDLGTTGGTVDPNGNNGTVSGVISGAGSLSKIGSGILTLSGINTYSGGTNLNGGTLSVANEANLGDLTGALNFNSSILQITGTTFNNTQRSINWGATGGGFDIADANNLFTVNQVISGSGNLVKQGAGTLLLSGANSYTGGTIVSNGVLQGNSSSLQGNIVNNASVIFDQITDGTYSSAMSGTGSLSKIGSGVFSLSGINTYSGGTNLNGGTLSVANDANLGDLTGALNFNSGILQITGTTFNNTQRSINWGAAGGGFDIADANNLFTVNQVISGSGNLVKQGEGTLVLSGANSYTGGTIVSNGVLQGNSSSLQGNIVNNASVIFDQATDGTYSSAMSGTGVLLKQNTGNLTFAGANTYSGGTTINQGVLSVNGSLASGVTVNTNGTLRGTGTINGNTVVAGRLAPGNSPGTLTFNGSVAMTPSSTLEIDVDGAGNYSRVLVQGAGNTFTAAGNLQPLLRGITGNASNTFNPVIGQSFNFVNATGGITGSFNALTQPIGLPAGTRFDALYTANTVQLAVTPQFYSHLPNVALLGNASAAGAALDAVRPATFAPKNPLFQSLATYSEPQVANALQQLGGEIHADLLAASFNAHRLTRQAVFGRLSDVDSGHLSSNTNQVRPDKNVWMRGMGGFISTKSDTHATGFNENLYGVMLGIDDAITENLQLGGAIGYVHNQVTASQFGNGSTDSVQFLGYGLWQADNKFIKFALGYGRDNYTSQRSINLDHNGYKSDVAGNSGSIDVEAGTRLQLANYTFVPSFGVRADIISRDAFAENGLLGLAVKNTTLGAAQTRLGAKINRSFELGTGNRITPELRAYWLHDEGDSIASRSQATLLGQSIGVNAANAGRDAASLGVGITAEMGKNSSLFADYNFEQRGSANGQSIFGGLRMTW